jgi:DNA-binding SARP family transcriptional activator/tetratricopeptide (TPR) repeat protein
MSVASLTDTVWDDDPPQYPRASLHNVVSQLRRQLGDPSIQTVNDGYLLPADARALDLLDFDELCEAAREADHEGDADRAVALLDRALALWRGPALADVPSEALRRGPAALLTERHLRAHELRADLALRLGRHEWLTVELAPLVREHPMRERLVACLMLALCRGGRPAEALARFEDLRQALAGELGVHPSAELRQMHTAILRAEPGVGPDAGPLRAPADRTPQQLPSPAGRLAGRQDDLAYLDANATGEDPARLIAIVGPGGVGKTALAVHWAHRMRDAFPDGRLYLELHGYGTGPAVRPDDALHRMLLSVGVPAGRIPADSEARAALMRSELADRRMLVVLDNARDSEQVRPLLPGPSCTVLVTSRIQMRGLAVRESARRLRLRGLDTGAVAHLLADATGAAPGDLAAAELAELTARCAGMPLALRIVAERMARDGLGLGAILAHLAEDGLDALDTGGDDLADMRAVFTSSYQALDAESARAFRLFGSAFGADLSLPAATALLDRPPPAARRALDKLIGMHMLERGDSGRYQMHDLLCDHGAELADGDDDAPRALRRLLDWYVHTARAAHSRLLSFQLMTPVRLPDTSVRPLEFATAQEAMRWFDTEVEHVIAAVDVAVGAGHDRHAWQLAWSTWAYFDHRKLWDPWIRTHEIGLAAARRCRSLLGEELIHTGLGMAYGDLREWETSLTHFRAAAELSDRIGRTAGESGVLNNIATVHLLRGEHERALESFDAVIGVRERTANTLATLSATLGKAQTLSAMGRHAEALGVLRAALGSLDEAGTDHKRNVLHSLMGRAHLGLRQFAPAIAHFQQALKIDHMLDFRMRVGRDHCDLGDAYAQQGDLNEARNHWRHALEIFTELGAPETSDVKSRLHGLDDRPHARTDTM